MTHLKKYWLKYLFISDIVLVFLIFRPNIDTFYHKYLHFHFEIPTYAAGKTHIVKPLEHTILKRDLILHVPLIQQLPELPRGCEVTTLAMLLQSAGIKVNKLTLAKEITKVPFETKDGLRGNPNIGFVGNMYQLNKEGYGVYHQPLVKLAKSYLPGRIIDLTGSSFQTVIDQVKSGKPVAVTVSYYYNPIPKNKFITWHTKQGNINISYDEHMVLITGIDHQFIYLNDPFASHANIRTDRKPFIESWKQFGSQAISYK